MQYIFGPVPSRRLGFSLGIDLVPFKTCSLDCPYCQLGKTTHKTVRRRAYGSPEEIISELRDALQQHQKIDYITIGGSGEPTLSIHLGSLISRVKAMTAIPVAVLTNAMVPGIAWGSAGVINSMTSGESYYTMKNEVLAIENVTVPAGAFNSCLKIHSTRQFGGSFSSRMDWYCPDTGLVKRINNGRIYLEMASVTYNE